LRKLLHVSEGLNPVTLGLAIQSNTYLRQISPNAGEIDQETDQLVTQLVGVRSKGYSGICWGYDFDWEARYTRIQAYVPTSVATGIITNGMFENYLFTKNEYLLNLCRDACKFIRNDLKKSYEGEFFCYSYSPVDSQFVFNASMKAARLLAQVYSVDRDQNLLDEASNAVEYVIRNQKEDGSWSYSKNDARTWRDNYHTGYILDCLDSYITHTGDERFRPCLKKGLHFYLDHFFEASGIPKFYHDKTYPIDSTAAAQSILSLCRFGKIELAQRVAAWYISNMQDSSGGFFFRKHRYYTDRNIFMRWSNAWMLVALSYLLYSLKREKTDS
jgi:rhamnogalacturonyl hydrolase YesR